MFDTLQLVSSVVVNYQKDAGLVGGEGVLVALQFLIIRAAVFREPEISLDTSISKR